MKFIYRNGNTIYSYTTTTFANRLNRKRAQISVSIDIQSVKLLAKMCIESFRALMMVHFFFFVSSVLLRTKDGSLLFGSIGSLEIGDGDIK